MVQHAELPLPQQPWILTYQKEHPWCLCLFWHFLKYSFLYKFLNVYQKKIKDKFTISSTKTCCSLSLFSPLSSFPTIHFCSPCELIKVCCGSRKVIVELSEFGLSSPEKERETNRAMDTGRSHQQMVRQTISLILSLLLSAASAMMVRASTILSHKGKHTSCNVERHTQVKIGTKKEQKKRAERKDMQWKDICHFQKCTIFLVKPFFPGIENFPLFPIRKNTCYFVKKKIFQQWRHLFY